MSIEAAELAKFYPLDKLLPENLEQLAREAESVDVAKGTVLFKAGDTDDQTIFVRAGRVRGDYPDGKQKEIDASTLQGRYALGDLQPRRFTATVISRSATLVKLDRRYMEKVQTWDQLSRNENFRHVDPSPDANRWVFRDLGLEPWQGVRFALFGGSPQAGHYVDVTGHLQDGIDSLLAHEVYFGNLGADFDAAAFLTGVVEPTGRAVGVEHAMPFEMIGG